MSHLVSLAAAVVVLAGASWVLWLRRSLVSVEIHGESMAPVFTTGDQVLVRRRGLECLRAGDVVVFEAPDVPGEWFHAASRGEIAGRLWVIKRVAALPGDPVPADFAEAPQSPRGREASSRVDPGVPVPPGSMLVLGDNSAHSTDSRVWGYIPAERVLGVMRRRMGPRQGVGAEAAQHPG